MDEVLAKALEYVDGSEEEIVSDLQKLISFKSIAVDGEGDAPFGEGVGKAFKHMLTCGENEGFDIVNTDNYGGHIQLTGQGHGVVGIAGHIDVVPEGNGWDHDPFGGEIRDDKLYGRGAMDDKGPVIACFNGMKALKRAGYVPDKDIRLILGLDEETNWDGMYYYLEKIGHPDTGFTPDGGFPVIYGEKGILVFDIVGKVSRNRDKGLRLTSLTGGHAHNMVPDRAYATVMSDDAADYEVIREKAASLKTEKGYGLSCKKTGRSLKVTAEGVSAHGSRPETGRNAISILMALLGELTFSNDDHNDMIRFYNSRIGFETDGSSLGIKLSDEESGDLTVNNGEINMDKDSVTIGFNVRYPVTMTGDDVYRCLEPVLEKHDLGVVKKMENPPIYKAKDSKLVTELMDVYKKYFHRDDEPMVIGGGTFARAVNNILAFGPTLPDQEDVAHSKNEYIEIDHLMDMTRAYTEAIYRLSKGE